MKKRKPTVGFITGDWAWGTSPLQPNGCAWYRCKLPADELKKRGWVAGLGFPGFNNTNGFGLIVEDEKIIHGWDIIVFKLLMQREVLEYMPRAKELGQKIVVDVDDFFDGLSPRNQAYESTDPQKHPDNNREIYSLIIMAADAVITSTPFLYDYYSKKRSNVYMVRNGIDVERYKKKKFNHTNRLKLGWVGATPWRSNDLQQLSIFMNDYLRTRGVGFHHSGETSNTPTAASELKILIGTSSQPLCPIIDYPKLFNKIDIGLVPLSDCHFNHAKSFIKGLEYAAAGVPFVSSYAPEYEFLANEGKIGRVAYSKEDWIYHLDELLDPQKRFDDIEHNYEMLKNFTMEKRGDDWDATMRVILEKI